MAKVLIVDDSKTIQNALIASFNIRGRLQTYVVGTLTEAKELLDSGITFFAAILDLDLPDAPDGEIVDLVLGYGIPSVVLTGNTDPDIQKKLYKKPIVDYIIKRTVADISMTVNIIETIYYINRKKALVVDDSKTSRMYIKQILSLFLFEVYEAEGGKEALRYIKENPDIKLITIDYEMPGMSGVDLAQKIRQSHIHDTMVLFAITGKVSNSVRTEFIKSGVSDYITKPLLREEFNARIIHHARLLEQYENIKNYVDTFDKHVIAFTIDMRGNFKYISNAFTDAIGTSKKDLQGKNFYLIKHEKMDDKQLDAILLSLDHKDMWHGELCFQTKNGDELWVDASIEPIYDSNFEIIEYQAVTHDITDKKKVEILSITDPLTMLNNRVKLNSVLEEEIEISNTTKRPLSLILIDIDYFKSVNDQYGHNVGDNVLKEFANILKNNSRKVDTVGRWGGEEFVVILPNCDSHASEVVAEKIRQKVELHNFASIGNCTASFGVSEFRKEENMENFINRADEALYLAKKLGRNRVEIKN